MFMPVELARIARALMVLLLAVFSSTIFAAYGAPVVRQAANEQVTLTVTSTCGSVSIRVKKRVLTTPFSISFPLGKTIQLKALDGELSGCGVVGAVSPFERFIVNQALMPEAKRKVTLTLDRDTAVQIQYGPTAKTPVTLSVWGGCINGVGIQMSENALGGQSGTFGTHFDAALLQGQSVKLTAPTQLASCGNLGVVLYFFNWSAGGIAYPENQTAIDLTLNDFTIAVAHYKGVPPTLRVNSYQLLRDGEPAKYVLVGEDFNAYTMQLGGDSFPPEITVFVDGKPAEILSRASASEITLRLPARKAVAPGLIYVLVTSPDSAFSNSVPIEIRKE